MDKLQQIQQILGVTPDGKWGPRSQAALDQLVQHPLDPKIASLLPPVQALALRHLDLCREKGITARVISGTRTYAEQEDLYRKYLRGGPTAAPPGHSNHNFGLAYDIGVFTPEGVYVPESPLYAQAGALGKSIGLTWGGDWANGDEPHFEMRPGWARGITEAAMLSELRFRTARGDALLA